jgi:16S rRNA (uracil1498-N3)-methyltransferase
VHTLVAAGERLTVEPAAAHHLLRVLRLRHGDAVQAFDGAGNEASAKLVEVGGGAAVIEVCGPVHRAPPLPALHLLLAVAKGPAMDDAVRMATEAGATDFHLVHTARSVPHGDRIDRWARIAAAAARQCGRADVPRLLAPSDLPTTLAGWPAGLDARVALPGAPSLPCAVGAAGVAVGPEGGFTSEEVAALISAGFTPMGLGRWTLRAETAAAVAVAMTIGGS